MKVNINMYNHTAFMTFLEFSAAELKRFEIRYENGYNLTNDIKYNRWKDQFIQKVLQFDMTAYIHIIFCDLYRPI